MKKRFIVVGPVIAVVELVALVVFYGQPTANIAVGTPEELEIRPMQGSVLDVQCERPQDVIEKLEALDSVKEAGLVGNGLHVVAPKAETASHENRAALVAAGVRTDRIEPIRPSMEDVFVSLGEGRDRMRQAA
ncbi:MAG: hypothetical protein R3E82_03815 [Pseudomonadales bacterium]